MSAPYCAEKQTLTAVMTEARQIYVQAARNLGKQSGTHFENFYREAEVAKRTYETARTALEAHTKEHGC